LTGKALPIVPPLPRRTLGDVLTIGVDGGEEDDELPDVVATESLARDPDYRREPYAVRIARALRRRSQEPESGRRLSDHCAAWLTLPIPATQRVLMTATQLAVARQK